MAKNAVAKTEEPKVPTETGTPDYMKQYGTAGMENIGAEDVETPRVSLLQALSPEVEKFGAKQGNFWHSILEEDLGPSLDMVMVYVEKTAVLWRPRVEGGGILARQVGNRWEPSNQKFEVNVGGRTVIWDTKGSVAESRLLDWGSSMPGDPRSLPAATAMINLIMYFPDRPDASPALMTFSKTALKPVQKALSVLKIGGKPSFGMHFTLSSEKTSNTKGSFFVPKFTINGVSTQEECQQYFELQKVFSGRVIGVSEQHTSEGDDAGAGIDTGKF